MNAPNIPDLIHDLIRTLTRSDFGPMVLAVLVLAVLAYWFFKK